MFERPHHQRIARVLAALDAKLLRESACLFGGGTAIALRYGEYRESVDIDFLVSDVAGYRDLRQRLTGRDGMSSIVLDHSVFTQSRDIRADQYGVRTTLAVDGHQIKFEIVLEARIELAKPASADTICGVAALKPLDMATTKMLANSDRWADDGVFSRDLIDLAMMAPKRDLLTRAIAKSAEAYGQSAANDLGKAIEQLRHRNGRLERCMKAMDMRMPAAALWQRVRALERGLNRASIPNGSTGTLG